MKKKAPKAGAKRKRSPTQGFQRGTKHPSNQLTISQVKAIRTGKHKNKSQADLAKELGVSASTISQARTGRTWSWLPGAKKPMDADDPRRFIGRGGPVISWKEVMGKDGRPVGRRAKPRGPRKGVGRRSGR
ncbi:MAG: helix-turn-helix domain-containing protein [Gemmatimonadaceae bacterium]